MRRFFGICYICLMLCPLSALGQQGGSKPNPTAVIVDTLPTMLNNTSSLFYWQGGLWTANDHGGLVLYEMDTLTAQIVRQLPLLDTLPPFSDMEETVQDDHYFYFGDFGNNHMQLRDDLRVLRLAKTDLLAGIFHFDTIFFTYDGYDPTLPGADELPVTDYDCEAMIATADSLYLFTKQWSSLQTTCYALPKEPGHYTAQPRGNADVYGLVTGACYRPSQRILVFTCYTQFCQPFIYLLYDFSGTDFFGGEHRRIPLSNFIGTQIEAIASADGLHYYLTNEHFSRVGITYPAQLLSLDLTDYLYAYLHPDTSHVGITVPPCDAQRFTLSPNPAVHHVEVTCLCPGVAATLSLYDSRGCLRLEQQLPAHSDTCHLDVSSLPVGTYLLIITTADGHVEDHLLLKN